MQASCFYGQMWLLCLVWLRSIKLCVLCRRWAAEPAAARRSDRDHLSKERLGACQRGSGLSADTHRGQPLSQMTWGPEPGSSHCLTRASAYISMYPLRLPHQPASCCPDLLRIHDPLKLKTAPHNGWASTYVRPQKYNLECTECEKSPDRQVFKKMIL